MTREEILEGLKEVLATVKPKLPQEKITEDSQLIRDLGVDSLSMLLLSIACESKFDIKFETKDPLNTVSDVINYIESVKK